MDVGLAAPGLVVHGFGNGAVLHDLIEPTDAGGVVADVLGADKSGMARHRIGDGAGREVLVRAVEPIDAEILVEQARTIILDAMKNALPLQGVPVEVEAGTGLNWLQAH